MYIVLGKEQFSNEVEISLPKKYVLGREQFTNKHVLGREQFTNEYVLGRELFTHPRCST